MWLNFKGKLCDLSHPLVMGILNYTEDSFFDGGRYNNEKAIVDRAAQYWEIVSYGLYVVHNLCFCKIGKIIWNKKQKKNPRHWARVPI